MEAVYQLLEVERGVPEVFASAYDLRVLANSVYYLSDKKKINRNGYAVRGTQKWLNTL